MPENTQFKSATQQSRKGINSRANQKRQRCQGSNGCKKTDSKTIANSIFALTLKSKIGLEVLSRKEVKGIVSGCDTNLQKMYYDLLRVFQFAIKLVKGEETTSDVYQSGLSIENSLSYIGNAFKNNIVPEDCRFNIDYEEDTGYFFTIYKEVEEPGHWVTFEIKPIVEYLWSTDRKLHDLFLTLINSFSAYTGIDMWYNGGLSYADDFLEEKILNWVEYEELYDEREKVDYENNLQEAKETIEDYKYGNAAWYKNAISKEAGHMKPDEMIAALSEFNKDNPVVIWMIEVCEFLKTSGSMSDFIYDVVEEEYYEREGLKWEEQVSILWDIHDHYTITQEEYLDAESQGCGIVPPILNMPITIHTKEINLEDFIKKSEWVDNLEILEKSHSKLIEILKTI